MSQSFAIWLVIAVAAVTANLPFVVQRPLARWPWSTQPAGASRAARVVVSVIWLAALAAVGVGAHLWIAGSLVGFGDPVSILLLLGKVLLAALAVGLLMGWAGRGRPTNSPEKRWWERLLELTLLYALVGGLGMALEATLGNPPVQAWPFYVVTACLYVILAYPGYVFRYLLKRRRQTAPFPERDLDTVS